MFCIKRIKTCLRTTMTEKRLTDIALLFIKNELKVTISLDDVLTEFEGKKQKQNNRDVLS